MSDEHPIDRAHQSLRDLATATYRLAGDLAAFDDDTLLAMRDASGRGVDEAIGALAADAAALLDDLERRRERYVGAQLKRLQPSIRARKLRVNIGSGRFPVRSWMNVDLPPAQLAINLRWGLPLPKACAEYAFMAHVLEHFYYPDEALAILKDIRRILKPGGTLRVIVPDIEKWLRAYAADDKEFFRARKKVWKVASRGTRLEQLMLYVGAGAGAHPSYFFGHKSGYDFETLRKLLLKAGFGDVEHSDFMRSRHRPLRIDSHSAVADAAFEGGRYSLFVDATAPSK